MIELKNVSKNYSQGPKIGPLNQKFPKGGITAIIGPNGAGKSSMITMIGRLMDMDQGEISIDGLDLASTPTEDLAKKLAILRQENHFVSRLTVRQLIGFGRFPYSQGRLTAEDHEIIEKYLHYLNLEDLADRYLDQLSGGQRQRAYVAMVLAQETEYVLLDEPLNNLDIARSVSMMQYLREICDQMGFTILIVLHDINFAARYADHICVMKEGKIVGFGGVEEIMQPELLSSVFETDIEIMDSPAGKIAIY